MMLLFFALTVCIGLLAAAAQAGRFPKASSTTLRRVLRPVALVVLASAAFGALIGYANARRERSGVAWSQIREARQRLDPKNKPTDPKLWEEKLAQAEARLQDSERARVKTATILRSVGQTTSAMLFLGGIFGGLVLLRLRIEQ